MARACLPWMPGVSTSSSWPVANVAMPSRRWRVVCAFGDTMLTLAPTRRLIRVDLPVLGRPTTATVPARNGSAIAAIQVGEHALGGGLLGGAHRGRLGLFAPRWLARLAGDAEHAGVVLAAGVDEGVFGARQLARLQ